MNQQLKLFYATTFGRYKLLLPQCPGGQRKRKLLNWVHMPAHLGHAQLWDVLNKVTVHSTSEKLLSMPLLYRHFNMALTCICFQKPRAVKSKVSMASFKMMRGSVLGVKCCLRRKHMLNFCYKWCFLAPAAIDEPDSKQGPSLANCPLSIGLSNVFVFELEYQYYAFSTLPGLELSFD